MYHKFPSHPRIPMFQSNAAMTCLTVMSKNVPEPLMIMGPLQAGEIQDL
jgi:hypothetical protein